MSLYRPFTKQSLYCNSLLTHRRARLPRIFPTAGEDGGNVLICVPGPGNRKQFGALATKFIPALDLALEKAQCFPFYTFAKDLFDYIYAILHHPEYCERCAASLRRELPRIPFVSAPPGGKGADDLFAAWRRLAGDCGKFTSTTSSNLNSRSPRLKRSAKNSTGVSPKCA